MKSKGNTRIVLRNLRDANGMFSEDALKLLALVTMFLDHVGAGLLKYFLVHTIPEGGAAWQYCDAAYQILRTVGRLSFPIYCYLLLQGFLHTRSVARYALRLFLFALLSEAPFDLLFYGKMTMAHQNVFWTLLAGLLTMAAVRQCRERLKSQVFGGLCSAAAVAAGMTAAGLLHRTIDTAVFSSLLCCICCAGTGACSVSCPLRFFLPLILSAFRWDCAAWRMRWTAWG